MPAPAAPRVSVVVPAKDAADVVADALVSLTRQGLAPGELQVVLVDDGSSDGTGEVAAAFAPRLPGLTVVRHDRALGLASARNSGLAHATGRYVTYLDADDWLAPGHLAHLAGALDALRCSFVRTDHTTVEGRERVLRRAPEARRDVVLDPRGSILPSEHSTMVDYPYAWAGMYDRALATDGLLTFPDGLHTAEDRPWVWRLHLHAHAYAVVDSPGVRYRRGSATSLTQVVDSRQLHVVPAFERVVGLVAADREADRWWPKVARTVVAVGSHHLRRAGRMTPSDRRALRVGVGRLVRSLPQDVVAAELERADDERRRLVRRAVRAAREGEVAA
ncbi:glycosyltransferase family 2 protein [Cellulomonas massiliensis]|uniref:glycosyltransferase family 2 protein n=1 Tax=Cellulomonas massiliensis TaxID=1465811 RepID=UPI0002EA2D04|nr:glycosyltransferase family 2 protein [Cellulomonas massiliensis]